MRTMRTSQCLQRSEAGSFNRLGVTRSSNQASVDGLKREGLQRFALGANASGRKITNGKQNYRVLPRRYLEAIGAVGANLRPFPSTDPSVASLETPEKTGYIAKKKNGNRSAHGPHRRDVTHSVSKVSCFLLETCHYRRLQNEKR